MVVDYHAIGRRVKAARLRCGITQEVLAERTGLSLPNISNIETGNTKLSLPAMIHVANALSVSVDTLLCDNVKQAKVVFEAELQQLLSDCTTEEMRVLVEFLKATKRALRNTEPLRRSQLDDLNLK